MAAGRVQMLCLADDYYVPAAVQGPDCVFIFFREIAIFFRSLFFRV